MWKQTVQMYMAIGAAVAVGIMIGVLFDKEWLTEQQLAYIQSLRQENSVLSQEREQWLAYVEDELKHMDVFVSGDRQNDDLLYHLLSQVGIKATTIQELDPVMERKGILITMGEELDLHENELPHIALEQIPNDGQDVLQLYVALLRLKGEVSDG
ncbi:hypothetical protein [Desertibacillus haloalkaliphilus]|uniref:hypothetical protein n=1 Tax=Desertibacillus haloalkaliphilus TaxID=1328930 RepID=UPI001C25EC0A|nr:hypothetical protein [Desertibacillus haloalkaliphilus]MBU8907746.1 hypothetical protein [Desertibacillus haloalkaliphilus]